MTKYLAFIKVAECKSFTLAAAELNYTQSAVSQMIRSLEKQLQTTLFIRSKSGLELTYEGSELLPYVRVMLKRYQAFQTKALELSSSTSGVVRIGMFATFAGTILPDFLKSFRADYPDVIFEFRQGYLKWIWDWADKDEIDFAIVDLSMENTDAYKKIPLFQDPIYLTMPEESPFCEKAIVPLTQLNHEIMLCLDGIDAEDDYPALLKSMEIEPNFLYHFCDNHSILSAVNQGLGMALMPKLGIDAYQQPVQFRRIDPEISRSIGLVYKKDKRFSPVCSLVITCLLDFIKKNWTGRKTR